MSDEERRERAKEWRRRSYQKNADKRRAEARAYQKANPEKVREWSRQRNARKTREDRRLADQRWRYGISPERFAQMLEEQDGRCYLGGELLDLSAPRAIHVDHDHDCCPGKKITCGGNCIRGLTCSNCNTGIGLFGDDPVRMEQVAKRLALANDLVNIRREFGAVQDELPLNIAPLRDKEV